MVSCCKKKKVEDEEEEDEEENIGVFKLKKKAKVKGKKNKKASGLAWRSDPTGENPEVESNSNFPRDNAVIEGYRYSIDGVRWVRALYVRQDGSAKWLEVPAHAYLPYEYEKVYNLVKLKGKGPTMIEIEEKELEEEEEEKKRRGFLGKICPCCFKKKPKEDDDDDEDNVDIVGGDHYTYGSDNDNDIENNRRKPKPSDEKKDE
jgi:hypothetical protein